MNRKTKQKLLSICLSIALVLGLLPVNGLSAKAAETDRGTIENAASVKTEGEEYTEENQTLETPIEQRWGPEDFEAAGIDPTTLMKQNVTAYAQITKCTPYSYIRFSAGSVEKGSSNKALVGVKHSAVKDSAYVIHTGSGENEGTGKGDAGTGYYVFPGSNTNKYTEDTQNIIIKLTKYTDNTEARLIGIVFSGGTSVTVNEDGTFTEGFDPADYQLESTAKDSTDPEEEVDDDKMSSRDKLKLRLDYAATMDSSKYQEESWKTFQTELTAAKKVYDNATSTEAECDAARASLEKVKSNMLFVDSTDPGNPMPFRQLSNEAIMDEMGVGTNLGNTMDGHSGFTPSETAWQSVETTKAIIKSMHDAGYNTVRIPVTWGNMIDTKNGYQIKTNWITRVQEIVDYCVSQDMYAIINIHHDGAEQSGWLRVAADDIDVVYEEFECVWRNIAEYFKDYDEHLIFESMNEITCMEGNEKNSAAAIDYDTPIIVNLNQIFVNVVRSTGSNNSKRWLAAVAHYANAGNHKNFVLPTDSYNEQNAIMFAAHIYKASTNVTWTYEEVYQVVNNLKTMSNKFDVPMYLGEYGVRTYAQSGTESGYNDVARAYFSEIVHRACQKAGVVPVVWDQGCGTKGVYEEGLFHYWDRAGCKPLFKTITDAMMRGTLLPITEKNENWDFTDVEQGVTVTEITEITPSETALTMSPDDRQTVEVATAPADSNDVVLWSSDDDSIATVYNGLIHAKGIGSTTIHVYSQSGSVEKEIPVAVVADKSGDVATSIETDAESYEVVKGSSVTINASLVPETANQYLTYTSSNEGVACVNAAGKVIGKEIGNTFVTITAANGITKVVKISVISAVKTDEFRVSLHVLYNDSALNYYQAEIGDYVVGKGEGTYTVDFDLEKDLSDAGKKAGVTAIKNLTAIYIKDYDVTTGSITKSAVKRVKVRYDKVVINGNKELTINTTEPKTGMTGMVIDTGGPINAWTGSQVDEVTATDHVANFTEKDPVTKISVTFTFSDIVWRDVDTSVKAESLTAEQTEIAMSDIGSTVDLTANVAPADTSALVSFVSADKSIVDVDSTAFAPTDGKATVTLKAVGYGTTTVTAYTDDGLSLVYTVTVVDPNAPTPTPVPTDPAPTAPAGPGTASAVVPTVPAEYPPTEVTVGNGKYKVTSSTSKTVTYVGPTKKTLTSVTVPATVKITENGKKVTYKVTAVAAGACKNCKKLKTVTIGKNVKKIGANAFNGCAALKKIKIKSTVLKSVGNNAIKGIQKKAVITCPSKQLKAYKKLFKSKVGYKKTMKMKKA